MRVFAFAALAMAVATGAALAQAQWTAWNDPAGRLSFQHPPAWPVDAQRGAAADTTQMISGTANEECQFFSLTRAEWAAHSADTMRRSMETTPIGNDAWQATAASIRLFRNQAVVQSTSADTSGFWPIQRAVIQSGEHTVLGGYQRRPGLEIWTFCLSYSGPDRADTFNRVISSVGTPRDAEWRTQAEAAEAQRAAAAAQQAEQQAAAEAAAKEKGKRGRRNRD
ncbi:MAG: hypothetical protein JNJ73_00925 [Hyphomonadaceae bacterium]|nr:hypothetical protein [Hyphomonadaceae bacterium]